MRELALLTALIAVACGDDAPDPAPVPIEDAQVAPVLDAAGGGSLEDRITIPNNPRDAAITELTPVLDLPLVVGRPDQPLSTAALDVLVIDAAGAPVSGIGVTTGGPAVITSSFGIAHVTAVYGTASTDVFAFSGAYALSHARVPIREGEITATVLTVVPVGLLKTVGDVATPGEIIFEVMEGDPKPSITFANDSFELPWGSTAAGVAMVSMALLDEPAQAGAVPGNMLAVSGTDRVALAGVLSFELLMTQGRTELELLHEAEVRLPWPAWASGIDPAAQQLYRFDAKQGAFVEAGALRVDTTDPIQVIATIDRLGHWLIGATGVTSHCARIEALEGGAPLAHGGGVLTSAASFSAARVDLDAMGVGCAALPFGNIGRLNAVARRGTAMSWAVGDVLSSLEPGTCIESCPLTTLVAQPIEIACVRGTIATPPSSLTAYLADESSEWTQALTAGEFCIEARAGTTLTILTSGYQCGDAEMVLGSTGSACGGDGCMDLGALDCCAVFEDCGNTRDDDCDGMIDEGCVCGSVGCTPTDGCCAGTGCGERSEITSECIARVEPFVTGTTCPNVEVPFGNGDTVSASGCCLMGGICGVIWDARHLCVPPADVTRVWGAGVSPPNMSCVF